MIRLHVVAEGQTEEGFVNAVLAEHLGAFDISTDVRCVETSRDRGRVYRGGLLDYARARRDLTRWMKEDRRSDAAFTTMFDLYALPPDFPDQAAARAQADVYQRVRTLEEAFARDVADPRFVPYLQVHEFEALLLSDPSCFHSRFGERHDGIDRLSRFAGTFVSPELIDDGPATAPSKRIIAEVPEYEGRKASAGPILAAAIGLDVIRRRCPHFAEWLSALERLTRG